MFRHPQAQCLMQPWYITRYSSLYSSFRSLSVLVALNLKNAEETLPGLLLQLPKYLKFLGPCNVHICVYESGSDDDDTQRLMLAREYSLVPELPYNQKPQRSRPCSWPDYGCCWYSYTIISGGMTESTESVVDHHIDSLARLRNNLFSPLFNEMILAECRGASLTKF